MIEYAPPATLSLRRAIHVLIVDGYLASVERTATATPCAITARAIDGQNSPRLTANSMAIDPVGARIMICHSHRHRLLRALVGATAIGLAACASTREVASPGQSPESTRARRSREIKLRHGILTLPAGCFDVPGVGIDTAVGEIVCRSGQFRIGYDIGYDGGLRCHPELSGAAAEPIPNRIAIGSDEGSIPPFTICREESDDPFELDYVTANIRADVNLFASLATPQDLQTFIAVLLGYRAVHSSDAVQSLITQLDGPYAFSATRELRRVRDPRSLPALIKTLDHPEPETRAMAAAAIRGLGERARPAIPSLLRALVRAEGDAAAELVSEQAVLAIIAAGGASTTKLRNMLRDNDGCVRSAALKIVAETRDVGTLADLTPDTIWAVARTEGCQVHSGLAMSVYRALQRIGPRLVPLVLRTLREDEIREGPAFSASCSWQPGVAESENALCNAARYALGAVAARAVSALRRAKNDPSPSVRAVATQLIDDLTRRQ